MTPLHLLIFYCSTLVLTNLWWVVTHRAALASPWPAFYATAGFIIGEALYG